ncbi:MAG: RsiV family protein [Muribaculaceae bacterium]|nr:RsiV family protein [Muribaculaceae bacterium]
MTIKNTLSLAVAALLSAAALSSCGGGSDQQFFSFQSISLSTQAERADNDSVKDEIPDFDGKWDVTVSGIIPVKVGGHELTSLNTELGKLACLNLTASPAVIELPDELVALQDPDSIPPKSKLTKQINLELLNPRVAVFRVYTLSYPEGAAHGLYSNKYLNYDVQGGEVITLATMFVDGYERKLQPAILAKLKESRSQLIAEDDEITITPNFRITEDGVEFIYGLYSVAPYSDGEPIVTFTPYELNDILSATGKKLLGI